MRIEITGMTYGANAVGRADDGKVVMLWRHVQVWLSASRTQAINVQRLLVDKGYADYCGARESLPLLNAEVLKRLLKGKELPLSGKKEELLKRVQDNFSQEELEGLITLRRYVITAEGTEALDRHRDIIKRHGMKAMYASK